MGGAKKDGGNALLSSALQIWQLGVMPQALFHASTEMYICKKKSIKTLFSRTLGLRLCLHRAFFRTRYFLSG